MTRDPVVLVRLLADRIEDAPRTLHLDEGPAYRCRRVELGYAFSKPTDCTCGLDALLAEARALVSAGSNLSPPGDSGTWRTSGVWPTIPTP
jgi:hypothetical protein